MWTVLLVEDNPSSQSLLEDVFWFDHVPAKLVTATSGEQSQLLAASLRPDLILMDLRLPGIDGLETTEMLKHNPLTKDVPVWAITAYAMPGDEERALAAGCDRYFTKPFPTRMLADHLRDFLQGLENTEDQEHASSQSTDR
jgi:two-component system, cell cycle response regulator DivK